MTSFLVRTTRAGGIWWAGCNPREIRSATNAIMDKLARAGLFDRLPAGGKCGPHRRGTAALSQRDYLKPRGADVDSGSRYLSTGDTDITPGSLDVAARQQAAY